MIICKINNIYAKSDSFRNMSNIYAKFDSFCKINNNYGKFDSFCKINFCSKPLFVSAVRCITLEIKQI